MHFGAVTLEQCICVCDKCVMQSATFLYVKGQSYQQWKYSASLQYFLSNYPSIIWSQLDLKLKNVVRARLCDWLTV
jgi:hypothetical protein